jgi:hypothetical protein
MLIEVFHPRDHKFDEIHCGSLIKRIKYSDMEGYLLQIDCQVCFLNYKQILCFSL